MDEANEPPPTVMEEVVEELMEAPEGEEIDVPLDDEEE